VHGFQPAEQLRAFVLDAVRAEASGETAEDVARRAELLTQLERLRDLSMMGDFTKPQYVMRRQALEEELQRTKPPVTPALDRAKALLEDFGTLWQAEQDPIERRKLIATLFEQIWQKDGAIVAVKPRSASPATSRPWRRRGQNAQKPV
jgi:hypothetical protein